MKYIPLTFSDRVKFEALLNDILTQLKELRPNKFIFNCHNQLNEFVRSAKYYNKTNNILLKECDFDSNVYTFSALNTETNDIQYFNLKAQKGNTIKRLFIYEVLKSQYANVNEFYHFKKMSL